MTMLKCSKNDTGYTIYTGSRKGTHAEHFYASHVSHCDGQTDKNRGQHNICNDRRFESEKVDYQLRRVDRIAKTEGALPHESEIV